MVACDVATPRTHDRKRNESDKDNKQIVLEGQAVIAIDNSRPFYGSPQFLERTNQIILANDTVDGLSLIREPVNLDLVSSPRDEIRTSPRERDILASYIDQFMNNLFEAKANE